MGTWLNFRIHRCIKFLIETARLSNDIDLRTNMFVLDLCIRVTVLSFASSNIMKKRVLVGT